MSAVVHAFALVVAPLFSAFAWLALAGFVPQAASSKVLGFSTSVSAYVGADIALWAIAAAEAFNNITLLLFELQLLLLLLVPALKYLSRSTQWLAASPYIPCIWAIAATLLTIRNPKTLINEAKILINEAKICIKEPEKARITSKAILPSKLFLSFTALLFVALPVLAAFTMLDSLYPATFIRYDGEGEIIGRINVMSHLVGTCRLCLTGYSACARCPLEPLADLQRRWSYYTELKDSLYDRARKRCEDRARQSARCGSRRASGERA